VEYIFTLLLKWVTMIIH